MFCTKCGKQLEDNVTFCIYCGAKIEPLAGGPAPMEPAPYQPQMTEIPPYQPQMTEIPPYQPQPTEPTPYQPQPTEPTPYQPQPTEPTPYQPQSAGPAPYQPQPTEPTPYQPQSAGPAPYQPQPTEPTQYQPQPTVDQQNTPGSAPPPDNVKTKKKAPVKLIVALSLVVVIAIGAVVAYMLLNSPTARMNRALDSGELEKAYDIYVNELNSGELSDRSIELLQEAAAKIQDDYLADSITYEEAMDGLSYIRRFGCGEVSAALSAASDSVQTHYQILTKLENAESYYQNGNYAAAISTYEEVLVLDPSNEEASSGLDQAKAAYYEDQFSQAKDLVAQGYYEEAIYIYQQVLSEDPSNTAAEDGLNAAKDAYREEIVAAADALAAKGDFEGAVRTIETAMKEKDYFTDDAEMAKALEDLRDREIEQMTDDVYDAADGGDWDGALDLLDEYQERYPSNKSLQEVREDILRKMPITLKNLTMVSSNSVEILTSVVSDRWGNIYDGAVKYDAYRDAYCLYNLDKRYVTFTGTVFVPTNASNGINMSFAIYLDEELVYYMDGITEETAPIPFEVNVSGSTTLRIVTDSIGYHNPAHLYFANTSFSKVTDTTEE